MTARPFDSLRPPKRLRPVLRAVVDPETGLQRISNHSHQPISVYVCPYCYKRSANRRLIEECCDQHFERLVKSWGELVDGGVVVGAHTLEPAHLPILTLSDNLGHLVGEAGVYLLELPDGRRFERADVVTLAASSRSDLARVCAVALALWPSATPK